MKDFYTDVHFLENRLIKLRADFHSDFNIPLASRLGMWQGGRERKTRVWIGPTPLDKNCNPTRKLKIKDEVLIQHIHKWELAFGGLYVSVVAQSRGRWDASPVWVGVLAGRVSCSGSRWTRAFFFLTLFFLAPGQSPPEWQVPGPLSPNRWLFVSSIKVSNDARKRMFLSLTPWQLTTVAGRRGARVSVLGS